MVIEIGRLCIKTAGRDAGKVALIVDKIDDTYVMIEGATRRRKCNVAHLEISDMLAKIKAKADHDTVLKALAELGFPVEDKKPSYEKKERKPKAAPKKASVLGKLTGATKKAPKKTAKKVSRK